MQTRFEQIAAAFPLHAQRIAELRYEQSPRTFETWLRGVPHGDAAWSLTMAFNFSSTTEGHRYWMALANGSSQRRRSW